MRFLVLGWVFECLDFYSCGLVVGYWLVCFGASFVCVFLFADLLLMFGLDLVWFGWFSGYLLWVFVLCLVFVVWCLGLRFGFLWLA